MPVRVDPQTLLDCGVCPRCHHDIEPGVDYDWFCPQCAFTDYQAEVMVNGDD